MKTDLPTHQDGGKQEETPAPDKDYDILPVEFGIRNDDSIWLQVGTPLKTSYSAGDVNLTPWAVATIARRCNEYAALKATLLSSVNSIAGMRARVAELEGALEAALPFLERGVREITREYITAEGNELPLTFVRELKQKSERASAAWIAARTALSTPPQENKA